MTVRRWGGGAAAAIVLLAMISAEAEPPTDRQRLLRPESTVVVHGREGSFGALGPVLASGQEQALAPVNGWAFPPGSRPGRTVVAEDGTVLMACTGLTIGAYDPHTNTFTTIRLPSQAGPQEAVPAVTDLLVLSAEAVAFAVEKAGPWPVFGVLTRAGGAWQALPANMFTGAQLGSEGLQRLARLPASRDLLLVASEISVLRLSGHYQADVRARYRYPLPQVSVVAVTADPTGVAGDERFVLGLRETGDVWRPGALQEFRYDQRDGSIVPVSAALMPGLTDSESRVYGFDHVIFDGSGNLWATTNSANLGGRLTVYARAAAGRRTTSGSCAYQASRAWGRPCRADYELLQAKSLKASIGLVADTASGVVVSVLANGQVMAVRAQGSGDQMDFAVGNLLDVGRKVLPIPRGDFLAHEVGAVDARQRLWFPVIHTSPRSSPRSLDQWLISVALADLFAPKPVALAVTPGQTVTVQAERSLMVGTVARRAESGATEIDSLTYVGLCTDSPSITGCGYDQAAGDGFVVTSAAGYGYPGGAPLGYRVEVARAGRYRLAYLVGTFESVKEAAIEMTVLGQRLVTPVSSNGGWRMFEVAQEVELPAGTHLLTLGAPPGRHGWFLNSFSFRRL